MKIERIVTTVDSHTAGEPTRVITGGLPHIPGETMTEKMDYFRLNLDFIRTALINEPRGHKDMIGAVLVPPVKKEADTGVFFLTPRGYFSLCGHGSIGVATTLVAIGLKPTVEPVTQVILDTPAGMVTVSVRIQSGESLHASLINVPSFLYAEGVKIALPQVGEVRVDIAYGGNFYILVNAEDLHLEIISQNVGTFFRVAETIVNEVNRAIEIVHPEQRERILARSVFFHGPPHHPQADSRTLLVGSGGTIDRSPCGTGTSARMGALYAQRKLVVGGTYCTESVVGTLFYGKVLEETRVGDFVAVVPEITASAYITGFHQFVIEPSDPLKDGFLLVHF